MNSYSKKEREYYNKMRSSVCMRLGIKESQYNWFKNKANELRHQYTLSCEQPNYSDKQANEIESLILSKAKSLQLFVYFQTDPRGASLYLSKNPIPENAYNTQSDCIY